VYNQTSHRYLATKHNGFRQCTLTNGEVHRRRYVDKLVAGQFKPNTNPNPNNDDVVEHIDGKTSNDNADNLRWKANSRGSKPSGESLDELSESKKHVLEYKGWQFENLYYDPADKMFYRYVDGKYYQYKRQTKNKTGANYITYYIDAIDTNRKQRRISYSTFIEEYFPNP
jgi:hypothetical protein